MSYSSQELERYLMDITIKDIIEPGITFTEPGSLNYLLYGSEPSQQSISIKMGKIGEEMVKKIINEHPSLELLECGVRCIDPKTKKKKDVDLFWKDEKTKKIYYREAKGNLQLDSEKLPATIDKINEIINYIKLQYPNYSIDTGLFNWSIYNRNILEKKSSHIKKCKDNNIKVDHVEDMFTLLDFKWNEVDYYKFFRSLGERIRE